MKENNKNKLLYEPKQRSRELHDSFPEEENTANEEQDNLEDDLTEKETNNEDLDLKNQTNITNDIDEKTENPASRLIKSFLLKNPMLLAGIVFGVFLFFLIIIILTAIAGDESDMYGIGYYSSEECMEGSGMWWPIGGYNIEESNGISYAPGTPSSTRITNEFGERDCLLNLPGRPERCLDKIDENGNTIKYEMHSGLDIGSIPGEQYAIAALSGTVIVAKNSNSTEGCGTYVTIDHGGNLKTQYCHLEYNSLMVASGQEVTRGQVLGFIGNTGGSTAKHLHFAVKVGEIYENPLNYISANNPRPVEDGCIVENDSTEMSSLSKNEFLAYMNSYYERTKNENFKDNFLDHAEEVYDASLKYNVNPEIVVSFAGIEMGFKKCNQWWNFWGIGLSSGNLSKCDDGPHAANMEEGIEAFAKVIHSYNIDGSWQKELILKRKEERSKAECHPGGYGDPNTLSGILSIYVWFGNYLSNPGSYSDGGCHYLKIWSKTPDFLGEKYNSAYIEERCPSTYSCPYSMKYSPGCVETEICEQSDFTYYYAKIRSDFQKKIFG